MSVIPDKKVEQLQFYESHNPQHNLAWAANAVAIGLPAAQATALSTLTKAARTVFDGAQKARNAAQPATTMQDAALNNARRSAADLIRVLKGFAEQQPSPAAVYATAQIPPPPASRSPHPHIYRRAPFFQTQYHHPRSPIDPRVRPLSS